MGGSGTKGNTLRQVVSKGSNGTAVHSFVGVYDHLLDMKSRVMMPRLFKKMIGTKSKDDEGGASPHIVLAKGFDGCLLGFSEETFPRFERALSDAAMNNAADRASARELAKYLAPVPVDTVGRIVIPNSHLELGGLKKGQMVRVVGMSWYFEIWNVARHDKYAEATTKKDSYEDRAGKLFLN